MKLQINGEAKAIVLKENQGPTLQEVIKHLGYHPQSIVVEFNGTILSQQKWLKQKVQDGDILEIVTIVGGGS